MERQAARERQASGWGDHSGPEKFTEPELGRSMDKVAQTVGMSRPTLEQEPVPNGTPETVAGAERRGGEILREVERSPGARTDLTSSQPVTRFQGAVEDAGLDRMTARRWQIIAAMPVESFEQHIAQMKARAPTGESPQLRPPHARKGAACAKCAKGGPPHARAGISPGLVCEMSEGVRHVRGEIVGRNTAKTAKG